MYFWNKARIKEHVLKIQTKDQIPAGFASCCYMTRRTSADI